MLKKLSLALLALLLVLCGFAAAMNRLAPMPTAIFLRNLSRDAAGLEAKSLDVQGRQFPYLSGGHGEPLVLVHGFTANKDVFDPIAAYLSPNFKIYAPDLPGFGDASRDPNADYSYDAQVDNLHAFIKVLGLPRVHLGGSSMGGGVVAAYAAKYPSAVASVWLIDAAATHELIDSDLMKHYRATGEFPLLVKTQEQQVKKMELLFGKPKFIPYSVEYALGAAAIDDFDLHSRILKALSVTAAPLEARYSNLTTPALIVTGDQDRVVPPASVQTLAKLFPNSQVKVMQGLGHIPMMEDVEQTANDYLAFRARLAQAK